MRHNLRLSRRTGLARTVAGALVALTAATGWMARPALAQDAAWPSRPLRMVVPFPAGSFTDSVARVLSDRLGKALGQPVVVDNKAGANGLIGVAEAAKAAPDGHTLLVTNSSSVTINPQLYKKVPYKATDLTPITLVLEAPFILVANAEWAQKQGVASFRDLAQFAAQHPGKLNYGSAGTGNIAHLGFAMLSNRAKVKTTHVPYKSAAQAQLALLGGELDAGLDTWTALPHIKAGKLRPLAVTAARRMAQLSDVPTLEEAGAGPLQVTFWIGLLAPAGVPAPVVQKLHAIARSVQDDSAAVASLSAQGEVVMVDPATFARRVGSEVAEWGALIQREGITLD